MAEGYLEKQENGRYGVSKQMDLTCGLCVEVRTASGWMLMRVEHDGFDYYLLTDGFSFYPKKVYVRYS